MKNTCKTCLVLKGKNVKKQKTLECFPVSCKSESGKTLEIHEFSQERCHKSLAKMCIKDNRPFSIVGDEGFIEYTWDLHPKFKIDMC